VHLFGFITKKLYRHSTGYTEDNILPLMTQK